MSSLSAPGVLIPAKTPPAEKPLAEEPVPFGTDAMGSVMAIIYRVPSQLFRNRRPGYLALYKASVDRDPNEQTPHSCQRLRSRTNRVRPFRLKLKSVAIQTNWEYSSRELRDSRTKSYDSAEDDLADGDLPEINMVQLNPDEVEPELSNFDDFDAEDNIDTDLINSILEDKNKDPAA